MLYFNQIIKGRKSKIVMFLSLPHFSSFIEIITANKSVLVGRSFGR